MPKLFSSKEIITILEKNSFLIVSQRGSHIKYRKGNKTVIVPANRNQIPIGTLKSIIRQSGISKEDWN